MNPPAPKWRLHLVVISVAALFIAGVALHGAVRWYEHPIAGVLVGPDLEVSSIGLPTWDGFEQGLRFPDRIVVADGVDLTRSATHPPAKAWDRMVEDAAANGRSAIRVRVQTAQGERELSLRLTRLEPTVWWLYGGATILVGALYMLAALAALSASPQGKLAQTFAKTSIVCALYLFTFFDAHTTRLLVPICHFAYAWIPFALVTLALRLPADAAILKRYPRLVWLLDMMGVSLAIGRVVPEMLGTTLRGADQLCSVLLMAGMLFFAVSLVVRFFRSTGEQRDVMRALAYAMAPPHAMVFVGILLAMINPRSSTVAFLAIPAFALVPISTGIVFIRHDIWGSRALLSRVMTRSTVAAVACALAIAAGTAFAASLGVPFRMALVAAAAGGVLASVAVYVALYVVDRSFFPAVSQYKPTIEQLSEELTAITTPKDVALAIERTVLRWLPCEHVLFEPNEQTPTRDDDRHRGIAESGTMPVAAEVHDLELPVAFGGQALGVLRVGKKKGGALFTSDDMDLLRTIANQAALALAHAHSYAELERRRRQQAALWQQERLALIETVAAEIAHEVRYPINFFRSVFRRGHGEGVLDDETIDIGCEEVDRLERLVAGLRRVTGHQIDRRLVSLTELAARTEVLLRDLLESRHLEIDVPEGVLLRCDPDQVTQILVNLVSNALEATTPDERIGIVWFPTPSGGDLAVWDTGPGFDVDPAQLFTPWFTTKPRGTGLGLAITHRLVRAHGWTIDAQREFEVTRFMITIPNEDIAGTPSRQHTAEVA